MNSFFVSLLLSVISALVAGLGIAIGALWFFVPLGLAGFFYVIHTQAKTFRGALFYGFLFGIITSAAGMWWMWDTLPFTHFRLESGVVSISAVAVAWVTASASVALVTLLYAGSLFLARRNIFFPIFAALLLAFHEELRFWIFSFLTWAPQSLLGPHFSTPSFGYSLAEQAYILQLAWFGGLPMLNFFAGTLAIFICLLPFIRNKEQWGKIALAGGCTFILLLLPLFSPSSHGEAVQEIKVALLSTNLPADASFPDYQKLDTLLLGAQNADVIVLPEGASLENIFPQSTTRKEFLRGAFGDRERLIIHSGHSTTTATQRERGTQVLAYHSTTEGVIAAYKKLLLMPFGEYTPWLTRYLFGFVESEPARRYLQILEVAYGRGTQLKVGEYHGTRFGSLLCSELFSPVLYRSLVVDHQAEVLMLLANHSWFHGSRVLYVKTLQAAKVHAVQNRRYLLAAMNGTPSFVVDPDGKIIAQSEWGAEGVLSVDVPVSGFIRPISKEP
jgi:apolipoprotein N-acyltransferase